MNENWKNADDFSLAKLIIRMNTLDINKENVSLLEKTFP